MEENADAVMIFYLIRGQLIMGHSGPIDINHLAIHEAMRLYEVRYKRACFEKVLIMAREMMEDIGDKNGEDA